MWPIPTNVIDLGVNIDHVATLRNARDTSYPDIVDAALWAEEAGADLITLHLREDRRHIRDADVWRLRPLLRTRMNLECAITDEMLAIACAVQPYNVCLVPERRTEITTEGGLDVAGQFDAVQAACHQLHTAGIHVSLFVDPVPLQIQAAAQTGAHAIELHTGCYANACDIHQQTLELQRLKESVSVGLQQGLRINAGHGLHYKNVMAIAALPGIAELNIGHAIVAHALFVGWRAAISEIKALMVQARLQNSGT